MREKNKLVNLLQNVNFTQSALTNELPAALTDLVLAETSKIRDMIEDQNEAVVAILKGTLCVKFTKVLQLKSWLSKL